MRLILAEKPSLARAIAAAIPGSHRRLQHHIECATGDVIAWCAGHILEMAPPEDYSPELASWRLEALPILPDHWKHRVSSPDLVGAIKGLLARATRVVHAGDPDREGQLLVDEVLLHLGWRGPTDRLLLTDLSPAAVQTAMTAFEPNERFRPLYEAALARQRADWLYGLNLTRLYTLRAQLGGYRGVVSVGRVQTPLLGLIVRRDREIEAFVSKPFYGVKASLQTAKGERFEAHWAVGKENAASVDPEGRLLDRRVAEAVAATVSGKPAVVVTHDQERTAEPAPLPYSLAELQIDAGRKLGLSAAQVLESAQRLYELQLLTYPRSDCSHLPEAQVAQAGGVLRAIQTITPALGAACSAAELERRSRAWNDSKVTAHHAIVPTTTSSEVSLAPTEQSLYQLVALRYVQQFLPAFEFLRTTVDIAVGEETFRARGRQVLELGWRSVERKVAEDDRTADGGEDHPEDAILPPLAPRQQLLCVAAAVVEKRTQPPKPFTDASLIQAMCGVAKFVSDPKAKKVLQDTDGIGTPATRAAILERLFTRGYVERRKKQIRATPVGRALIDALPTLATTPDQTAAWEVGIRLIHDRKLELDRFVGAITRQIGELVTRGKAQGPLRLPEEASATSRATAPRPRGRSEERPRRASKRSGKAPGRARAGHP